MRSNNYFGDLVQTLDEESRTAVVHGRTHKVHAVPLDVDVANTFDRLRFRVLSYEDRGSVALPELDFAEEDLVRALRHLPAN